MSFIGAKHPCIAPITAEPANSLPTYGTGVVMGELIGFNTSFNFASGQLDADDDVVEQDSEFTSGTATVDTADIDDSTHALLSGATIDGSGDIEDNGNDTPPYVGIAFYRQKKKHGVRYWKGYFFPRAKASIGNENAQTKGQNINYQNPQTPFTILKAKSGAWRIRSEDFTTEAAAQAWVETKVPVAVWRKVSVMVQGSGLSADKDGVNYVATGANITITVTGAPTVLIDNGATFTLTDGAYTISAIAADHEIFIGKTA